PAQVRVLAVSETSRMGQLGNREAGQGRRSYGAQQDEAGTGKGHGCTRELYARFHVDESGTHRRVSAPCLSGRLGEGAARVQGPECTVFTEPVRREAVQIRSSGTRLPTSQRSETKSRIRNKFRPQRDCFAGSTG